jgi:hypothetical protein
VLHSAVVRGSVDLVKSIPIPKAITAVNSKDQIGDTALHIAASHDSARILNSLLSAGADVNAVTNDGITPLHEAVMAEHCGLIQPLIQSGDLVGSIRAVHKGDTSFIGILRTAKTKDGKSLFNIARAHEYGAGPKAVRMSPKQRAFLAMMFKRIGTLKVGKGGGGVLTIRIPARPFVRPVFKALFGDDLNTMKRITKRLAALLPLAPKP